MMVFSEVMNISFQPGAESDGTSLGDNSSCRALEDELDALLAAAMVVVLVVVVVMVPLVPAIPEARSDARSSASMSSKSSAVPAAAGSTIAGFPSDYSSYLRDNSDDTTRISGAYQGRAGTITSERMKICGEDAGRLELKQVIL
jgi:hypothetical protein